MAIFSLLLKANYLVFLLFPFLVLVGRAYLLILWLRTLPYNIDQWRKYVASTETEKCVTGLAILLHLEPQVCHMNECNQPLRRI